MFHALLQFPAYGKIGISFAGILLLNRFGLPLGFSILLFAFVLSLWSGTGIPGLIMQIESFRKPENYLLPVVIVLLLFFTEGLNNTGRMEHTVSALKSWFKNKKMLWVGFPALIGLLPMPGGALFSAPLVESIDDAGELDPGFKTVINYWFRHIWEYWWPLYPGVILALRYTELPLITFFLIQFPLTVTSLLGGYFFILKKIKGEMYQYSEKGEHKPTVLLSTLGPIGVVVLVSLLGSAICQHVEWSGAFSSLLSMLIGLSIALILIFSGNQSAFTQSLQMFTKPGTWHMVVLIIGVLAFSSTIKSPLDESGITLVTLMRDEFLRKGIPVAVVVMLVPFISGVATGVAFGFVGASFPIVFALIGENPSLGITSATTVCAYAFGYMGMMLSPIHVCLIVTCEYFGSPLLKSYEYMVGPTLCIFFAALIFSGLYFILL